ncbi:MAG: hypothetical protein CL912_25485 [Deltaproteobacteria bacterium]|nr:hypothetical protein [Deltaproteobacteria bacterium]
MPRRSAQAVYTSRAWQQDTFSDLVYAIEAFSFRKLSHNANEEVPYWVHGRLKKTFLDSEAEHVL